ncbi:MAG: CocE/NonD family hydrolase [Deltaproteobacteria bacterium]|nr:CocE/NonD family hydrolase [Deltaproteobacteria bacterium]
MHRHISVLVLTGLFFLLSAACGGGNATFSVRESVEQLHVTHAQPGTTLVLEQRGEEIARGTVDGLGSLVFREVPPGEKYRIRTEGVEPEERSDKLTVMSEAESLPEPAFYAGQVLQPGFNYLETRDGTLLSAYVNLPGPVEDGPYPTLVNYSGYSPSKPGEPIDPALEALCDDYPVLCDSPTYPSGIIGGMMGYATVGVNIRGTGCSGGAYDFFETLQRLDGYDVIETVAAQSWVKGNKVGMVGLSYPGISQLFTARERPPSLAAIAPLSVIGNTMTTLAAGGILNDGFAIMWADRVSDRARPYAQGWEQGMVDAGDTQCEENQLLHDQMIDAVEKAYENPYYTDEVGGPVNPSLFVDMIDVPVFTANAWQDEQTGPGFAVLLDRFTSSPYVRRTVYNGVHPDGYAPQILMEWKAFFDIYVAEEITQIDPFLRNFGPTLVAEIFGGPVPMPPDRFPAGTSLADARAEFEATDPVRVIFESGSGEQAAVGLPAGGFEVSFPEWPVPGIAPARYYFQADGSLASTAPAEAAAASTFTLDPAEGQEGILAAGSGIWDQLPVWDWKERGPANAVAWVSEALTEDTVMIGHASIDLFVKASGEDADLEVTLSEVRPDGEEMYVQNGWLRLSHRKLQPESTELVPVQSHKLEDVEPLAAGQWNEARIPLEAFAHVFRAGSRIRISVDTPGGSRADWRFNLLEWTTPPEVQIAHQAGEASSVLLPVVPGIAVPTALPACPSLRGQPCRTYAPYTNTAAP